MATETELKYRANHRSVRRALKILGARRVDAVHEANLIFDNDAELLRRAGLLMRVRVLDRGSARLTFKGPKVSHAGVKTRDEYETTVVDTVNLHRLLMRLGLRPLVIYGKDRETWEHGRVEIALDSLVFGSFCELEGPEDEIRKLARALRLRPDALEQQGYPNLARQTEGRSAGAWRSRDIARAFLLDPLGRTLLLKVVEPTTGRAFWALPGGGVHRGESDEGAVARELREEIALDGVDVGPCVWTRDHRFIRPGRRRLWRERHYLVQLDASIDEPRRGRFWSVNEIEQSAEPFAPAQLAWLVRSVVEQGPPPKPIVIRGE